MRISSNQSPILLVLNFVVILILSVLQNKISDDEGKVSKHHLTDKRKILFKLPKKTTNYIGIIPI